MKRIKQIAAKFIDDRSGSFTVIYALAAPILILAIAMMINFTQAMSYRQELQSAADAAALGATTAVINGATPQAAEDVGKSLFAANSPAFAAEAIGLSIDTTVQGSTATTVVNYQTTTLKTIFGSVDPLGSNAISVSATSQGGFTQTTNASDLSYDGAGGLWGDPHLTPANDSGGDILFPCQTSPKTWYNALSDAGIEFNFACQEQALWNYTEVGDIVIEVGGHIIKTGDSVPDCKTSKPSGGGADWISRDNGSFYCNYGGKGWFGEMTIDGVTYNPRSLGTTSYLNGMVSETIYTLSNPNSYENSIKITSVQGVTKYVITITYGYFGEAQITFAATNAGKCGVPGGIWGQTLAGVPNSVNAADYVVASGTALTPEYNWNQCPVIDTITQTSTITQ